MTVMQLEQGVIVAVLLHAAGTIWWASRMNTTLVFIAQNLGELKKVVDEERGKTDLRIDGLLTDVGKNRHDIATLQMVVKLLQDRIAPENYK